MQTPFGLVAINEVMEKDKVVPAGKVIVVGDKLLPFRKAFLAFVNYDICEYSVSVRKWYFGKARLYLCEYFVKILLGNKLFITKSSCRVQKLGNKKVMLDRKAFFEKRQIFELILPCTRADLSFIVRLCAVEGETPSSSSTLTLNIAES